jgi:hypothetical protein
MESPEEYEEKARREDLESRDNKERLLAEIMGITPEEYREIGCYDIIDLDGSHKVYWSASADSGIVAKIKGKQAVDDEHVTISQDMSQLGDGF